MKIPKRRRGRQSRDSAVQYQNDITDFADELTQIQSRLDFKMGARDWCYYLEGLNLIDKGEFDTVTALITAMRKDGSLPIDFTSEDASRMSENVVECDDESDYLASWRRGIINGIKRRYTPTLLSDHTHIHIEIIVEKKGLVGLFKPISKTYQIPITNLKGWGDINSRVNILERCYDAHLADKEVILLYVGDFDPAGINIAKSLTKNFSDLEQGVGFKTSFIDIRHVGLTYDFIIDNDLIWVDNLFTSSSGKTGYGLDDSRHADHNKSYVTDYIERYGVRKVEANAMMKNIDRSRAWLLNTITTIIKKDDLRKYKKEVEKSRGELLATFKKAWVLEKDKK